MNCPRCGGPVEGIETSGPDRHEFDPCGCSAATQTPRDLAADEPRALTDGGRDGSGSAREFRVRDDGASITYGPWSEDADEWMLGLSVEDGERVRLLLGEAAMYELWTEVQHVPWPRKEEPRGTLSREIVEKVRGMDADQLREVLETVDAVGGFDR